jgi:hypothetical protein
MQETANCIRNWGATWIDLEKPYTKAFPKHTSETPSANSISSKAASTACLCPLFENLLPRPVK